MLEVGRVGRTVDDRLARRRVSEAELDGVQPLPRETERRRQRRVGAVRRVADAGVPLRGHVDADLVRPSRLEVDLEQRRGTERLDGLVVRHRGLPVDDDRELPVGRRMATDGRVDRAGERVGMPLHDGVVDLLDGALAERLFEHGVGALGLRDDHEAGGADVESMHDAGALCGTAVAIAKPAAASPPSTVGPVQPDGRVSGDAHGLVDDHDLVVVVDDVLARARRRATTRRRLARGPRHLEPRPGFEPVGLAAPGDRRPRRRRMTRPRPRTSG